MTTGTKFHQTRSRLEDVYQPIQNELERVGTGLRSLVGSFGFSKTDEIVGGFFQRPGKFLRPALAFFSAQSVSPGKPEKFGEPLIQLGVGVELIHSASLVHDDILDDDLSRRGQKTVNGAWGNKVALLIGDALYSRAFGTLTRVLNVEQMLDVVGLNELMVSAEVEQASVKKLTRATYYRVIEGKTARFMSLCCALGASLASGTPPQIAALANFGLQFGLAYQLFDDAQDHDLACDEVEPLSEGQKALQLALAALEVLPESGGKAGLTQLAEYVLELGAPGSYT
ncbi:MAG: polyprenyl synthetase family protein [Spirochaetales bacterium]|nr:polyprenyl synthetase family protein [Spirochaetales bacterium]